MTPRPYLFLLRRQACADTCRFGATHEKAHLRKWAFSLLYMVAGDGIEPPTRGFSIKAFVVLCDLVRSTESP